MRITSELLVRESGKRAMDETFSKTLAERGTKKMTTEKIS
jgi:hypothetical protein